MARLRSSLSMLALVAMPVLSVVIQMDIAGRRWF
jgi:hypothetical protein